jgi:hypothetical protein
MCLQLTARSKHGQCDPSQRWDGVLCAFRARGTCLQHVRTHFEKMHSPKVHFFRLHFAKMHFAKAQFDTMQIGTVPNSHLA